MTSSYVAPAAEIISTMQAVGLEGLSKIPAYAHADASTVETLVEEFGRFATEILAPTDREGDRTGAAFDPVTRQVSVPVALKHAYRRYVEGGWGAVGLPLDEGGGGLPPLVTAALEEMFASANLALSLNPALTRSAIEVLLEAGSANQRARYLPKLATGEWTGTMNLTEPDAGSDLGALNARAVPANDGTWRVTGSKIFITWGDHNLADNVVHLVLARTPGAPAGTRGLSLFIVCKMLQDGSVPNAVHCRSIERKLGIHASPTCSLDFEDAVGELIGEEGKGMAVMFTMMNAARRSIALQGVASAECSYQQALNFATTRRQGRRPGAPASVSEPIIVHPDVRRMLLDLRSTSRATRLLAYTAAAEAGLAASHPDESRRDRAQRRVDLLTPMAKAWCTDCGVRAASVALQVHGGVGYIEETGVAQRLRDIRIAPIYEGTNGIQAIDLVARKLPSFGGRALAELMDDIDAAQRDASTRSDLDPVIGEVLGECAAALRASTAWLLSRVGGAEHAHALAGASPYLHLVASTATGAFLARWAMSRSGGLGGLADDLHYFTTDTLAPAAGLVRSITAGTSRLGGEAEDSDTTWKIT